MSLIPRGIGPGGVDMHGGANQHAPRSDQRRKPRAFRGKRRQFFPDPLHEAGSFFQKKRDIRANSGRQGMKSFPARRSRIAPFQKQQHFRRVSTAAAQPRAVRHTLDKLHVQRGRKAGCLSVQTPGLRYRILFRVNAGNIATKMKSFPLLFPHDHFVKGGIQRKEQAEQFMVAVRAAAQHMEKHIYFTAGTQSLHTCPLSCSSYPLRPARQDKNIYAVVEPC